MTKWIVILAVVASAGGCTGDRLERGFGLPLGTLEDNASDRTREDLGIDRWQLTLVGDQDLSIRALGPGGDTVAQASVTLTDASWIAAVSGKWDGRVEIDRTGEVVEHTIDDARVFEFCRDDLADGFRGGGAPGQGMGAGVCEQAANAAVVACDNGAQDDQCMMDLLGMYLECEQAAGKDGGAPPPDSAGSSPGGSDTDGAGSDTQGSAGSEGSGGSGGSGGSEGSGGGSGGSSGGGGGSGGWGSSGGWGESGGSGG